MPKRFIVLLYLLVTVTLFSSCGQFEHIRKSNDVNFKLTKANEYFDNKQYSHANELYKELVPIMKSTRNYEALSFKYAYSYYYMKDFLAASYFFKNFSDAFPMSKDAEECEFMSTVCLYRLAPKYTLDQTNSLKALEALESFVSRHPNSTRIKEAQEYINLSHAKLETKEANAAKLYFNIAQYKAASTAFKSVIRNYPESSNSDFYLFMAMKSMYKYAKASIAEKQEERYASALTTFRELKDNFPKSKYLQDAEKIYADATENVKKIRNEHK